MGWHPYTGSPGYLGLLRTMFLKYQRKTFPAFLSYPDKLLPPPWHLVQSVIHLLYAVCPHQLNNRLLLREYLLGKYRW